MGGPHQLCETSLGEGERNSALLSAGCQGTQLIAVDIPEVGGPSALSPLLYVDLPSPQLSVLAIITLRFCLPWFMDVLASREEHQLCELRGMVDDSEPEWYVIAILNENVVLTSAAKNGAGVRPAKPRNY